MLTLCSPKVPQLQPTEQLSLRNSPSEMVLKPTHTRCSKSFTAATQLRTVGRYQKVLMERATIRLRGSTFCTWCIKMRVGGFRETTQSGIASPTSEVLGNAVSVFDGARG